MASSSQDDLVHQKRMRESTTNEVSSSQLTSSWSSSITSSSSSISSSLPSHYFAQLPDVINGSIVIWLPLRCRLSLLVASSWQRRLFMKHIFTHLIIDESFELLQFRYLMLLALDTRAFVSNKEVAASSLIKMTSLPSSPSGVPHPSPVQIVSDGLLTTSIASIRTLDARSSSLTCQLSDVLPALLAMPRLTQLHLPTIRQSDRVNTAELTTLVSSLTIPSLTSLNIGFGSPSPPTFLQSPVLMTSLQSVIDRGILHSLSLQQLDPAELHYLPSNNLQSLSIQISSPSSYGSVYDRHTSLLHSIDTWKPILSNHATLKQLSISTRLLFKDSIQAIGHSLSQLTSFVLDADFAPSPQNDESHDGKADGRISSFVSLLKLAMPQNTIISPVLHMIPLRQLTSLRCMHLPDESEQREMISLHELHVCHPFDVPLESIHTLISLRSLIVNRASGDFTKCLHFLTNLTSFISTETSLHLTESGSFRFSQLKRFHLPSQPHKFPLQRLQGLAASLTDLGLKRHQYFGASVAPWLSTLKLLQRLDLSECTLLDDHIFDTIRPLTHLHTLLLHPSGHTRLTLMGIHRLLQLDLPLLHCVTLPSQYRHQSSRELNDRFRIIWRPRPSIDQYTELLAHGLL
jgi:hypothetical protein